MGTVIVNYEPGITHPAPGTQHSESVISPGSMWRYKFNARN